jgi:hypothetical protein
VLIRNEVELGIGKRTHLLWALEGFADFIVAAKALGWLEHWVVLEFLLKQASSSILS